MTTEYRGFKIEVFPINDEYEVTCKRLDGSAIEHEDNPDYYDNEEDAIAHGKVIIDEFLS
jgi:hypothetical protein